MDCYYSTCLQSVTLPMIRVQMIMSRFGCIQGMMHCNHMTYVTCNFFCACKNNETNFVKKYVVNKDRLKRVQRS